MATDFQRLGVLLGQARESLVNQNRNLLAQRRNLFLGGSTVAELQAFAPAASSGAGPQLTAFLAGASARNLAAQDAIAGSINENNVRLDGINDDLDRFSRQNIAAADLRNRRQIAADKNAATSSLLDRQLASDERLAALRRQSDARNTQALVDRNNFNGGPDPQVRQQASDLRSNLLGQLQLNIQNGTLDADAARAVLNRFDQGIADGFSPEQVFSSTAGFVIGQGDRRRAEQERLAELQNERGFFEDVGRGARIVGDNLAGIANIGIREIVPDSLKSAFGSIGDTISRTPALPSPNTSSRNFK